MNASTATTYLPRPIECQEVWATAGWQVKVYGIAYGRPAPRPELVAAAKRLATQTLPPVTTAGVAGVGFVGAHDARGGHCFVFVDWWADENELHHKVFSGPSPDALRPVGPDDQMACVWDLTVIDFERRSWYDTVMRNTAGPDLAAYLGRRLRTAL